MRRSEKNSTQMTLIWQMNADYCLLDIGSRYLADIYNAYHY
ncbi:MAG: hypothetical protein WCR42_06235 [bacterium]